jgi:DNA repair exonuclease SbcCD ATPase subunit
VSARAAAARRESPLSNSGTDAEQDARAETVAVLDDLKERLSKAETSSEQYRKQAEVLQSKLDDAIKEQVKFEEKVHEAEEQIEALQNAKRDAARQMREMEAIYEGERVAMTREKEEMGNREEEMQTVIQRLKDSLSQRNNTDEDMRPSRQGTLQNNSNTRWILLDICMLMFSCCSKRLAICRRRELCAAVLASPQRLSKQFQTSTTKRQINRVPAVRAGRGPNQTSRVRKPRRRPAA